MDPFTQTPPAVYQGCFTLGSRLQHHLSAPCSCPSLRISCLWRKHSRTFAFLKSLRPSCKLVCRSRFYPSTLHVYVAWRRKKFLMSQLLLRSVKFMFIPMHPFPISSTCSSSYWDWRVERKKPGFRFYWRWNCLWRAGMKHAHYGCWYCLKCISWWCLQVCTLQFLS